MLLYLCIVGISREVGEKKIMIYYCIFKSRYLYNYTVIAHTCLAFLWLSPPSFSLKNRLQSSHYKDEECNDCFPFLFSLFQPLPPLSDWITFLDQNWSFGLLRVKCLRSSRRTFSNVQPGVNTRLYNSCLILIMILT